MKRWMCTVILLLILVVIPLTVHAAPLLDNGTVEATATPLPDGTETTDDLSKALGTLAVYAAIIAALAAGTEVITDLLRPFFGLQRQPQAMETFEQMKEWLPQTLKEMGADPQAQAQLQGYLNGLDSTVEQFKTYTSGEKIAETVQKWALGLIKSGSTQLDAKLTELETTLERELKLNSGEIASVKADVEQRAKEILAALESAEEMLKKLRDLLKGLNLQAAQIESAVGKALELMNTQVEDEELKQGLKDLLALMGVPSDQIDLAVEEAGELLKSLKGAPGVQGVIKLASSLDSFDTLLKTVESQRAEGASYLRRLWRALRDWKGFGLTRLLFPKKGRYDKLVSGSGWKKSLGEVLRKILPDDEKWAIRWAKIRERSLLGVLLYYPEQAWNWLRDNLFSSAEGKESLSTLLTPENAAKALQALDRQHHLTEARRQRLLRFTTVFIGIALAVVVRIDSLQLLDPIIEGNLPKVLYTEEIDTKTGEPKGFLTVEDLMIANIADDWAVKYWPGWIRWALTWMIVATPGMILSGLAASAGSSFWHDQLDRLRAAKEVTKQVKAIAGQVQSSQDQTT